MNCNRVKDNLLTFYYNELGEREKEEVLQHLNQCRACQNLWEEMRSTLELIPRGERDELGDGYWDDYTRRLMEKLQQEREKGKFFLGVKPVFSGVLILLLLMGFYVFRHYQQRVEMFQHLTLFENYEVVQNLELLENMELFERLDFFETLKRDSAG